MKPPFFTIRYLLLCFASFSFFFSLFSIMPVMPFYVLSLGGSEIEVGIAVGLFTFSALASRLFIGREVDRKGRRQFLMLGSFIFLISSVLYLLPHNLASLYALRAIHGTGIAAFTTASTTLVADISPLSRRGEAMSLFGLSNNVALSIAPAAGAYLLAQSGFTYAFISAIGGALAALTASYFISDRDVIVTAPTQTTTSIIARSALFPASILVAGTMVYGMVTAYLPLMMAERALGSAGIYFSVMAGGLITSRLLGGRLSDVLGRRAIIIPGLLLTGSAVGIVAIATNPTMVIIAAAVHGLGFGAMFPGLMAFTVDRSDQSTRGKAMALLTSAFDAGIGLGTTGLGWLAAIGYTELFITGTIVCSLGIIAFETGYRKKW